MAPVSDLVRRARVGGGDEYVVAQGEVVVQEGSAIVVIGNAGDDELVGAHALADEEVPIPLGGDAEVAVLIGQAIGGGAGQIARQLEAAHDVVHEPFGVGHALLNEDERLVAQVLGYVEVSRGDVQVVLARRASVIDG